MSEHSGIISEVTLKCCTQHVLILQGHSAGYTALKGNVSCLPDSSSSYQVFRSLAAVAIRHGLWFPPFPALLCLWFKLVSVTTWIYKTLTVVPESLFGLLLRHFLLFIL